MKALTQYGRQAEKHWREHCPKMVRALEAKGQLHAMLLEAEEKTKDEMIELTQQFRKQGLTAQQAHDRAWEMVRESYILLPAESWTQSATMTDDSPKNLNSYRITEADRLGEGGPKQKFQQNLKAIKILRALDAEDRPASPDEKALLVKYVGWGAMPQVFDVDSTDWRKEQIQLSEILSDEEHRSARATTLNAHYTAPVVIRSMYEAAQRFGFQGGNILEPACGIGHFIGLMPEDDAETFEPSPALKLIR